MTQGIPISPSRRLHSSLCSLVTRTWRRDMRSMSSAVPVSRASSSASFASSRRPKRCFSWICQLLQQFRKLRFTHNTALQVWRFAIEDVTRLYAVVNHSDGSIEEAHQMTDCQLRIYSETTDLVTSPLSFISIWPSCCLTAIRNW